MGIRPTTFSLPVVYLIFCGASTLACDVLFLDSWTAAWAPLQARFWLAWIEVPSAALKTSVAQAFLLVSDPCCSPRLRASAVSFAFPITRDVGSDHGDYLVQLGIHEYPTPSPDPHF